ncbi:hypothetical protein N5P37_001287 [Trichoderma harzianum]|uniref:Uncharacterized protein n=1 Tax=Trichoderma harzianum CBS 226.95 TaxID=983964 RepID=A0A2T4ARM5_TRIHA|nr:hypothetical protein M431DRAFT_545259 [Trichoderma harzianum CBS 226.95]KAK0765361.1 hypothetical protein N5P37_001287 [Trichoderma harzianum]PKK50641.1 hypothetical protein CI102_5989 [Trichoderma harzianum]PTB59726.1 hypothetical protein M431DRAFT_545259 [Trichoderma harzianum CBS 226.95]
MNQNEATDDSVPTVRFMNIEDLVREKHSQQGDALRLTNVSLADFNQIDEEYEWNKIRISQYVESSHCMLVSIPTTAHEVLHLGLESAIIIRLHQIGLDNDWGLTGAVTCYSQGFRSGGGNGSAGSADSSMMPFRKGQYIGFPTLMIEAGCSWSLASMRAKAKWWFQVSNHTVKTVLLAKLDESRLTIFLERWEERQQERAGDGEVEWVAACQQTITISDTGSKPPVYQVTGGDLMLNLKLLLLDSSLQEEEYAAVTIDDFQLYAERVFEYALGRHAVSR